MRLDLSTSIKADLFNSTLQTILIPLQVATVFDALLQLLVLRPTMKAVHHGLWRGVATTILIGSFSIVYVICSRFFLLTRILNFTILKLSLNRFAKC